MMKLIASLVTLLAVTPALANEVAFVTLKDLDQLLTQQKKLKNSITRNFEISYGYAGTRISESHPRFGGKSFGPYIFEARMKGSTGGYPLEVIVCTSKKYVNDKGIEVPDFKAATKVKETFKYYIVRDKASSPPSIPSCSD